MLPTTEHPFLRDLYINPFLPRFRKVNGRQLGKHKPMRLPFSLNPAFLFQELKQPKPLTISSDARIRPQPKSKALSDNECIKL